MATLTLRRAAVKYSRGPKRMKAWHIGTGPVNMPKRTRTYKAPSQYKPLNRQRHFWHVDGSLLACRRVTFGTSTGSLLARRRVTFGTSTGHFWHVDGSLLACRRAVIIYYLLFSSPQAVQYYEKDFANFSLFASTL